MVILRVWKGGRTVFDADYTDGICEHGEHAVVVRMDLVRDVAMDEDFAWA